MGESVNSSFTTLLTSLSADPLTKGKQFERLVKWWLTQDPIWSRKIQNVWLWDEWPDYPGRDIGIDLVAQMTDGTLCAVQAKCFDDNRDIPKSELDSFISAASHRTFQHRLLVATTDGLSANAKRMLADQHVVRVMRSDLESSIAVWPSSIDELNTPDQPVASPRPHQQLAISDVVNGLGSNSRGQLIMACGTGKTLTALWINEALKPKQTLVLVPSLNLLAQTLSEWAKNSKTPWQYLCVCSDDTVNKSDDQPISTVDELPFEVTTKPADIAEFLSLDGEKIIFSTYQSSAQVAKAQDEAGTSFDLVICDEAHRLTGKTNADYATVLDEKKIVAEKRLFMTATPRTYTTTAKTKAADRGVEITSMDDEHVYGPVLHKLSFGEAIKQELLSDYQVLIVGVTDPQVQDLIDRRELVSVNDSVTTDARTLAAHIGLAKATKDYNLKRTISFHSRIRKAEQFARDHHQILEWVPESHKPSGEIWTGTISGAMNTGERRKLLTQLRSDGEDRHALLTNARCLTEGVDVPSLDGVAFIDPRSSQVDIIQAVGRAIRKSENKEIGTIVLPVLIPTDADAEHALEDTAFKPIWAILNALKSHDEELAIELNKLRTELGKTGHLGNLPTQLIEDLPTNIDSILPGFSEKLSIAILQQSTSPWDFWFGLLSKYIEEHGNSFVPHNYLDGSHRLGQWVNSQRTQFKNGDLPLERVQQLENLQGWTWNQLESMWNSYFQLLSEFVQEFGHCLVPHKPVRYKGERLFAWVMMQRTRFSNGLLEIERKELLESLPGWTWTPKNDSWEKWLELLRAFVKEHGHSSIPRGYLNGTKDLGRWVTKQRSRYRKGVLEQERVVRLEKIPGWTWQPFETKWEESYSALEKFVSEHGHAQPNQNVVVEGIQIGVWVSRQRSQFKSGRLDVDKVLRLQSLPDWSWDPINESWEEMFTALIAYTEQNGSATPTKSFEINGLKLGAWVSMQRALFNKGKLSDERVIRLQSLENWTWDLEVTQWNDSFDKLVEFAETYGTTSPSQSEEIDGFKVGIWVNQQRQNYRKGRLEKERVSQLASLPGWTWQPTADKRQRGQDDWKVKLGDLKAIASQFGSVSSPQAKTTIAESGLNNWIQRQRINYRDGNLPGPYVLELEAIPGWAWSPYDKSWEQFFNLLQAYVDENGHSSVPQSKGLHDLYKGRNLGSWVSAQRSKFSSGKLDPQKAEQLAALPGWTWNPKEDSWDTFYELLLEFVRMNGHALVPQGTAAQQFHGHNLSRWVNKQRSRYNSGKLEKDRITKLELVPGWEWKPFEIQWKQNYQSLKEFADIYGHVKVPRDPTDEHWTGLATWATSQRRKYRTGKLTPEQMNALENLPNWSW